MEEKEGKRERQERKGKKKWMKRMKTATADNKRYHHHHHSHFQTNRDSNHKCDRGNDALMNVMIWWFEQNEREMEERLREKEKRDWERKWTIQIEKLIVTLITISLTKPFWSTHHLTFNNLVIIALKLFGRERRTRERGRCEWKREKDREKRLGGKVDGMAIITIRSHFECHQNLIQLVWWKTIDSIELKSFREEGRSERKNERKNPKVDGSKKVSEKESIESLKGEEWQREWEIVGEREGWNTVWDGKIESVSWNGQQV